MPHAPIAPASDFISPIPPNVENPQNPPSTSTSDSPSSAPSDSLIPLPLNPFPFSDVAVSDPPADLKLPSLRSNYTPPCQTTTRSGRVSGHVDHDTVTHTVTDPWH